MDLSSIEQIIRTRVPNAPSDNVELYLDSVDRVLSRGGDYSDMSEDDVVEDFEYYIQSRMDEVKKPTTKMKKSELKEMIKSAFLSEADFTSGQDDDAAPAIASMYDPLYEAEEESLDDILARIAGTKADPYMAEDLYEAEEEEEEIEVDAEEKTEKPANDSIVVDKRIVSLSSLPSDTRKILDSLETLRAQAEEFGDQKFITQVGNTITFFTRDFVVAGDEPTKAKVDESLEMIRMKKLAGLLKEGEYAKALLNETTTDNISDWDEGLYIAINKKPSPEMQIQIAKEANKEFFVDMEKIKFGKNPNTGEYSVFIPFAGDYSNMMDVLEKFGIGKRPYTSPHLK
jgi:hypothetical protein